MYANTSQFFFGIIISSFIHAVFQSQDDGGLNRGALYIIFLNNNGTVKTHQKISSTTGTFNGLIADGSQFGFSVANIGDFDGDGVVDLVAGAINDPDGGGAGAVWLLYLNNDGTVKD